MPHRGNRKVATAAVLLGLVISAFEGTVVTTAMPTITRALGGAALYAWVFTAFLLACTLGVMLVGKLGDHLGRKPAFLGGIVLFLAGSALCGLANSVPALIAFRVIQGLGAGAIQPTTMTIAADLYTLRERAVVQSVFTGVWGLANVLGPVIGGWIVGHASWRWVFLVNVPVSVLAGVLLAFSYEDPERKPGRVDLAGPLLAGTSVALLLVALEPETGALLRTAFAVTGAALGTLFLRQQRASREPLVPMEYLRDRTVQSGLSGGAVAGALLYATTAYVPLWLTARGYSALTAGFALVPMLAGWALGSVFGVKLMIQGGMRWSVGGGFALASVGALFLAVVVGTHEPIGWAFAALALLGVGLGPAASTSTIGPQSVVPWRARSVVTSAVYSTRMLGGAVAIALLHLWHGAPGLQVMLVAPIGTLGGLALLATAPGGRMDEVHGLDLAVD
ncbi:MAG TPA: MFS transporter [Myxococcales bacterium]|nr:MFS transporter [Myxococcales bacterium]